MTSAEFYRFPIDGILKIVAGVNLSAQEVIIGYPHKGYEYKSRKAYILLKK